jgi:hypothetical protein
MKMLNFRNTKSGNVEPDGSANRLDPALQQESKADALEVLGWLLGLFDVIPMLFVWSGFRVGSYMWLYWFLAQASTALTLIRIAFKIRTKASNAIERTIKEPAVPVGNEQAHHLAA